MSQKIRSMVQAGSLLGALVLGTTAASAKVKLGGAQIHLDSVKYAGTGCPVGSVWAELSPDDDTLSLRFDQLVAEAGAGIPITERRKNCILSINLDLPSGWSFSLNTVQLKGYAQLDSAVTATQTSEYWFQGIDTERARLKTYFFGPLDTEYATTDHFGAQAPLWSPCGASRALNLNVSVDVRATGNRQGLMTIDSVEGFAVQQYGLIFKRCR